MKHRATGKFWWHYRQLPADAQQRACGRFRLLETDPTHESLSLKRIGRGWSVRAGAGYRALGVASPDGIAWFWIGPHDEYERLIKSL